MLFQLCKYIRVLLWATFHWKVPLEKWFFKFWSKSKWHERKIGYLAAILKWYNISIFFFCRIVILYNPYIYGENFIAKFWWENGFLRGFHGTPLGTNGSKSTLVTKVLIDFQLDTDSPFKFCVSYHKFIIRLALLKDRYLKQMLN